MDGKPQSPLDFMAWRMQRWRCNPEPYVYYESLVPPSLAHSPTASLLPFSSPLTHRFCTNSKDTGEPELAERVCMWRSICPPGSEVAIQWVLDEQLKQFCPPESDSTQWSFPTQTELVLLSQLRAVSDCTSGALSLELKATLVSLIFSTMEDFGMNLVIWFCLQC